MWIDIVAALVIIGITYLGYRQGALKQVLSLAALALVFFFAGPLAQQLSRVLNIGYVVNLVICAVLLFVAARVAFWILNRQFGKETSGKPMAWNQNLGVAVGLVKGEVVVWLVACLALVFLTSFPNLTPDVKSALERSVTGRVAQATNPFGYMADFFSMMSEVISDEAKRKVFTSDPQVQTFLRDEKVQRLMQSTTLREKLGALDADVIRKAREMHVMEALERATGRRSAHVRRGAPPAQVSPDGSAPGRQASPAMVIKGQ